MIPSIASRVATPSRRASIASLIIGMQDAVRDEARVVVADDRASCPSRRASAVDGRRRRVGGRDAPDHLDERHDRHRIHEVHPDEAVRAPGRRGQARDRDRRRVGGEDRVRPADPVELAEELLLDGLVLDDGLDDDVGARTEPRDPSSSRAAPSAAAFSSACACPWRPRGRDSSRSRRGPSRAGAPATSTRTTVQPEAAATCAMPPPICPPPTTPRVRICMDADSIKRTGVSRRPRSAVCASGTD